MTQEYNEKNLLKLDPRMHIRTRTGMYLIGGTTVQGLHEIVLIVLEDSATQALNGYANSITVTLHNASTITIEDDREYTTNDIYNNVEKLYFEMLIVHDKVLPRPTKGKFHLGDLRGYYIAMVNALCAKMEVVIKQSGSVWEAQYAEGLPISDPKMVRDMQDGEATGTKITFSPDFGIFEKNDFQPTIIMERLRELSFLIPNITYTFVDYLSDENGTTTTFFSQNGLADYVTFLNRDKKPLHPPITLKIHDELENPIEGFKNILIEIAFQYVDDYIFYPLNYINTKEAVFDGVHINNFLNSLIYTIPDKTQVRSVLLENHFTEQDIRCGLTVVISVFHPRPIPNRAIGMNIINPELNGLVSRAMSDKFKEISETDPQLMDILHQKCLANYEYHHARKMGE